MVGAIPKVKYSDYEIALKPGDAVFVYTDGVPEACNTGQEFFGMERLEQALNVDPKAGPEMILKNVQESVDLFREGEEQFDDLTMLCIEYKKKDG